MQEGDPFRNKYIYIYIKININILYILYIIYIFRATMTSLFEGQPAQNKALFNQNKGPHLGSRCVYIYIYIYKSNIYIYIKYPLCTSVALEIRLQNYYKLR